MRPEGNTTGLSDDAGPEIVGKLLELLKETAPHMTRVAVRANPPSPRLEPDPGYGMALAQT